MTRAARCASAFAAWAGADAVPARHAPNTRRGGHADCAVPPGGTPAAFAAPLAEDRARYARIIAEKHITAGS